MEFFQSIHDSILKITTGAKDGCPEQPDGFIAVKSRSVQLDRRQRVSVRLNLAGAALLLICLAESVFARPSLSVGPLHWDDAGEVSVVVELPEKSKVSVSEFKLVEDGAVTVEAHGMDAFRKSKKWQLALALCVDVSGSMVKSSKNAARDKPSSPFVDPLSETRDALDRILKDKLLRPTDRVAVFSFASKIRYSQWFTQPDAGLRNAIDKKIRYPGEKSTMLYDALDTALDHLERLSDYEPSRRRVLVISDGEDEKKGKIKDFKVVRGIAIEKQIPIDVVARVREDRNTYVQLEGHTQELNALASETGGRFELAGPGQVYDAIRKILTGVMNTPVLQFRRAIQEDRPKTSLFDVKWEREGKSPLAKNFPKEMPKTQVRPPEVNAPEDIGIKVIEGSKEEGLAVSSRWALILIGLILLLAIIAWFWLKARDGKSPDNGPIHEPESMEGPESEPIQARVTVVGDRFAHPSPGTPSAVLVGVTGPVEGARYPVDKDVYRIGAAADNDLSIPDDEYVSAHHAALRLERESLFLFDQDSKNKTYLNGVKLGDSGAEVGFGDRVQVGASVLEVTAPD